jgi:hypothetical protein
VLAAFIDSSTLVEFCDRALKTVCALSSAGAERVTPIAPRHANGCSPARRLSARASWRPQYPLLSTRTCRSPLATENSQVCRVVDREGDHNLGHGQLQQHYNAPTPTPLFVFLFEVAEMPHVNPHTSQPQHPDPRFGPLYGCATTQQCTNPQASVFVSDWGGGHVIRQCPHSQPTTTDPRPTFRGA